MDIDEFFNNAKTMRPTLLSIAKRIIGNDEEAEDVVQDAMLRLWQLKQSSPPFNNHKQKTSVKNADAMIKVMVRNLSIDFVRKKKNLIVIDQRDFSDDKDDDYNEDQINRVMTLMKELPTMQQTVLRLRHFEGMEMADIAQLIGSTEQAVRQSLSRARRTIFNRYNTSKQ